MTQFTRENLNKTLIALGAELTDQTSDQLFMELHQAHADEARFYHNEQHISECLSQFQLIRTLAERPAEVEIAFWFHDAVYETKASDNEARSAEWAKTFLSSVGVDEVSVARVVAMIIATKSHKTYDTDSALLVDIDLGILGASEAAFERYDEAIRSEFHWAPLAQYKLARAQVLRGFLNREFIYKTDYFRSNYEQQARNNLELKIRQLMD
ncbi:HD domain-containing protein [Leucothrix mucor]|uniref:HD domain-containing protein n=1 Tax=Leucothrix mucor TaxID=45248 RepID=UPI0003B57BEE|nr:N-methyl-D-aspartate receptor NMDAR2C subunit [Leucothrix mucor]